MRRIDLSDAAIRDLDSAALSIGAFSLAASDTFLNQFVRAAEGLRELAERGHRHRDVDDPSVLVVRFEQWLILYRVSAATVRIIRVVHGRSDLRIVELPG